MSSSTCTYLWISPKDYARRKVRDILDRQFDFEYGDDSDAEPDEEGLIRLYANEAAVYCDLHELAASGVPFDAREDSRMECEGTQMLFVAYGNKYVYIQEDGNATPVVPVKRRNGIDREGLAAAKLYHKLRAKFVERALKALKPAEAKA